MKKNLITVIVLALVLVNLVYSDDYDPAGDEKSK